MTMTRRNLIAAGIGGMAAPAALPVQASAAVPRLSIALFGQSNAARWNNPGCTAKQALVDRFRAFGETREILIPNLAVGGSAFLERNCAPQYPTSFWVTKAGTAGPMLERAVKIVAAMVTKPAAFLMIHGETDGVNHIGGDPVADEALRVDYIAAANLVADILRAAAGAPSAPVFVQTLGPRSYSGKVIFTPKIGYAIVRAAHYELATQPRWALAGTPSSDTTLLDSAHYTDAGLRWCAERAADAMRGRI